MGIEGLIIAVVIGVFIGVGLIMLTRRKETLVDAPRRQPEEKVEKKQAPPNQRGARDDGTMTEPEPVAQPSQEASPGDASGTSSTPAKRNSPVDEDIIMEDVTDDDMETRESEPEEETDDTPAKTWDDSHPINEELKPAIDDTQTMKAVSPKDTQEMKETLEEAPRDKLPGEVVDWMDKLEKEEAGEDLPSLEEGADEPALDISYPEKQASPATTAHFSAFYPDEAQAGQRYGVYIYAHAESMLEQITADVEKFKTELGGNIPQAHTARTSKSLAHGTKITVLLESEEIEFEPEMITKRWHGDWTRYAFEFRPDAELVNETAFVRASIMVMGFEIAKIKFAIDIVAPQVRARMTPMSDAVPTNPFARAKLQSATTAGYDKIFISYSRKDKLIAEAFKVMQEAAGNDVFFDVDDIRTGEDWKAAIAQAIDDADYLQLFWSENSANSEWCSYEWDYALNYRCQEDNCREFIRPVWWMAPMPAPPPSLRHLNFRQMDFETLMKRDDG